MTTPPHSCHAPRCSVAIPSEMFACRPHWFMLPAPVRAAIWRAYRPGQEITKDPSPAYLAAARACHRLLRRPPEARCPVKCEGLHCNGCGRGGGGLAIVALVVVVIVASKVRHAADDAGRFLGELFHWVLVGLVVTASVGAAVGLSWAAYRICRWQVSRRRSAPLRLIYVRSEQVPAEPPAQLAPPNVVQAEVLEVHDQVMNGDRRDR